MMYLGNNPVSVNNTYYDYSIIAPDYSELTFPVSVGQYCIQNGRYYVANQDIATSEAWTAAHWDETTVGEENTELNESINAKYTKPSGGIPATDLASGVIPAVPVQDVQVNGTSILSQGVANVPVANSSTLGAVKVNEVNGIELSSSSTLIISRASDSAIKGGSGYKVITPYNLNTAVFYGLPRAAGDTTQENSSNSVGIYTETAKSKIHDMLDAPETVSGSTPSITAKAGVRYVCGECATLSITPPQTGCIDVVFTSGSTPTVLTVPNTVKFPEWFDAASLEANRTYEINILDGVYGAVTSWA